MGESAPPLERVETKYLADPRLRIIERQGIGAVDNLLSPISLSQNLWATWVVLDSCLSVVLSRFSTEKLILYK